MNSPQIAVHDVYIIINFFFVYQKSYGKTTRFKIFQVQKVVFMGQTRASKEDRQEVKNFLSEKNPTSSFKIGGTVDIILSSPTINPFEGNSKVI